MGSGMILLEAPWVFQGPKGHGHLLGGQERIQNLSTVESRLQCTSKKTSKDNQSAIRLPVYTSSGAHESNKS